MVHLVSRLTVAAAGARVPLAYRGCIAVGELALSESYFVGEAIDEAATWHEQADAAITWVTPSARARAAVEPCIHLLEWPVVMKTGGPVRVLAANPLWTTGTADRALDGHDVTATIDSLVELLLRPFNGATDVDVVRKRQNTEAFLHAAREHTLKLIPQEVAAYDQARAEAYAELRAEEDDS